MFRLVGRALVALATVATVGVGINAAQAAPAPAVAPQAAVVRAPVAEPRLVDVDFQQRGDRDRVIFRFRGGVPDDVSARLVRTVRDADGDRVRLPGRVFLVLRFEEARARGFDRDVINAEDLDNVRAVRLVDDRRDVVRVAVGLRERADVDFRQSGNRLIVDIDSNDNDRD